MKKAAKVAKTTTKKVSAKVNSKDKKKDKKIKHEKLMQTLPPSVFSCSAHPDEYLKIYKPDGQSIPNCKSCGMILQGIAGYLCCPKSKTCFTLCSICRVCSNNHPLVNAIRLSHIDPQNQLYSLNKFNCHGCKLQKTVGARGVYHCIPCKFSICVECIDKSNRMWETLHQVIQEQEQQKHEKVQKVQNEQQEN